MESLTSLWRKSKANAMRVEGLNSSNHWFLFHLFLSSLPFLPWTSRIIHASKEMYCYHIINLISDSSLFTPSSRKNRESGWCKNAIYVKKGMITIFCYLSEVKRRLLLPIPDLLDKTEQQIESQGNVGKIPYMKG